MTQVDQSLVQMKFDNAEFERRSRETMSTLDKLKSKLTLKDSAKAMQQSMDQINSANFDSLSKSADRYSDILNTKVIARLTVVQNLMNKVVSAGENMVKSLTIDPVSSGWDKYQNKLAQTQTIMNATGKTATEVDKYLDKLAWYADETSYSFDDMTRAVGNFTASGVAIDRAIPAVIGIANAGGLAGTSIQNVSHAMEGFAKAIGQGYMQANQWDWIETARMNTEATKQAFIDAAVELGKLQKQVDGSYLITGTKDKFVSAADFTAQFRTGWLDTEVMLKGLQNFGDYSEAVFQKVQEEGILTADAMDALSGQYNALGEQGMRAAQESKTLEDAINGVRDAVSSGWSKTFQILFGGFEEAKDLWASVYDELYDIFGVSGEVRNEMLEGWAELGGREELLEALAEGWRQIRDIVDAVKEGISEVIPPKTAKQLYDATVRFREFMQSLKLSQEALYSLKVIAKTLALPIKLLGISAKMAGLGFKILIYYSNRALNTILTMASNSAYAAEVFQKMFKFMFGEVNGERIYNSLTNIFNTVSDTVSTKIEELKQRFSDSDLSSIFTFDNLIEGLKTVKDTIGELVASLLEAIDTGDWSKFGSGLVVIAETIGDKFGIAKEAVHEFFTEFLHLDGLTLPELPFDNFKEFLEYLKEIVTEMDPFGEALDVVKDKGTGMIESIKAITSAIIDFCKNLSPSKILIFGFGLALIDLIAQFSRLTSATANVVTSFSGIGKSAKGILDAIKYRINPIESKFKDIGNLAIKVAFAFAILAGSLKLLANVPADQLKEVTATMLKMSGAMAGIVALIGILGIIGSKLGGATADINGLSFAMLSFAVAVGTLTLALYMMDGIDIEEVKNKLLLIAGVVAGVAVAIRVLGTFSANTMEQNVKGILAFAASILIITLAINQLDPHKALSAIPYLITMFGMMSVLVLAMGHAGKDASDAAKSLTKIASALMLMNIVILLLGASITHFPVEMAIGAVVALIELLTMMGVLFLLSKAAGVNALGAGKGLREIASALSLLIIPIAVLGLMPLKILAKGITAVGILMTVLAGISLLASLGKKKQMSKGLLEVAGALTLLVIPIAILGAMPIDQLLQGGIAVSILLGVLAMVSQLGSVSKDAKLAIMPAVVAIGLFTAAILLLTLQDWDDVIFATSMLSIAVIALGASMRMMASAGKNSQPTKIAPLIVSVAAIGVLMAGLIGILSVTEDLDAKDVAYKLGGVALVIAAIGVAMKLMTSHAKYSSKIKNDKALIIEEVGLLAAVMVEVALLMNLMNQTYADPATIIANAAALSGVLIAVSGAAYIMSKGDTDYKLAKENAIALGAFMAEAALMIGLMSAFGTENTDVIIANAAALSLVILATASAARIMVKGKKDFALAGDAAIAAGVFLAAATVALGVMMSWTEGTGADPLSLIPEAFALGLLVNMLAVASVILSKASGDFKLGLAACGTMALLLISAATALGILASCPSEGMLEKATALSEVLIVISGIATLFGLIPIDPGLVTKGMEGVLIVVAAIAVIAAAVSLVAGLIDSIPEEDHQHIISGLERIQDVFVKIGEVLGGFVGGIAAGYNDAATSNIEEIGTRMSNFINNLSASIDNLTKYDESILSHIDNFKEAVSKIKDASKMATEVDSAKLNAFSASLIIFATNYSGFAEKIQGVTDASVSAGVTAMNTLATMTETLAGIKKYPDMAKFSSLADSMAPIVVKFSETVGQANFSPSKAISATSAVKSMVEACQLIATGNIDYVVSGNRLSLFGTELGRFSVGYSTFANNIKTVDQTVVDAVIATATSISEFASKLPREDGLLGMLFGNAISLGTFAEDIAKFGENWPTFAANIEPAADRSNAVKACASAAESIATLYNKLPKENGWAQKLKGDAMSLTEFAVQLNGVAEDGSDGFAKNWVKFAKDIDPAASYSDNVKKASEAAVEVAKIYSGLPTEGSAFTTWFTGEKFNLTTFGQDLSGFGLNFSIFSYRASQVNKQACIDAAEAAKAVIDVYSQLPSTGGWLDQQINGTQIDMETFAETIKGMGTALYEFNIAAGEVSYSRILTLSQAMASVVETSKKMGDFKTKNVDNFKNNIDKLKTAFSELKTAVTELPTTTEVETAMASFDAIFGDEAKWTSYGENVLNAAKVGIATKAPEFATAVIDAIKTAFEDNKSTLTTALQDLIKDCAKTARENTVVLSKLKQTGKDMINGIIKGLKDPTTVGNLNKATADALINAVKAGKEAIESHSPSKLTKREWGANMMSGAAEGISEDKTLANTTEAVLDDYVSNFAEKLSNNDEITDAIQNGINAIAEIVVPNAAEQGRTIGESFGHGIVDGLKSVGFNRSTIAFGQNIESLVPGIREIAKELGSIDVKALKKAPEANIASGFYVQGKSEDAALNALLDKVKTYDLSSVSGDVYEWKKIVSSLDFDAGFTFDDLINYLDNLDMDALSTSASISVKKIRPIVENLQEGLDVISSFESFIDGSSFDINKSDDVYKRYESIANNLAGSLKIVGKVEEAVNDLEGLSGYNLTLAQTSTNRIAAITKALEEQATLVSEAESRYLKSVSDFGANSEQASRDLADWTKQKLQFKTYQDELDEINKNGGKLLITSTTEYATVVLDIVRDKAEELKEYIGLEGNAYVELVYRIQGDIADGILSDPRIMDAIAERFDDIISMFDGLVSRNDSFTDIMDQEYEIWEKTKGRGASDSEKQAKKLELVNKKLEKSAEKQYYLNAARMQAIAMFGEGSDEALEAQKKYNDAYLEAIELAEEKLSIENEIAKIAANGGSSTTKGLTAREKAEKEFQEWKKDGSLRDWHYYGATDEELMEALIKKYEDDEAQNKKEQEANDEFIASFEQINEVLKETVSAIDTSKLDINISNGLLSVADKWGRELAQALESELQNYRSGYGGSVGGGGTSMGGGSGGGGAGGWETPQYQTQYVTAANLPEILNDSKLMKALFEDSHAVVDLNVLIPEEYTGSNDWDPGDNHWIDSGQTERYDFNLEQLATRIAELQTQKINGKITQTKYDISDKAFEEFKDRLGDDMARNFNMQYKISNTEENLRAVMDESARATNELNNNVFMLAGVLKNVADQQDEIYKSQARAKAENDAVWYANQIYTPGTKDYDDYLEKQIEHLTQNYINQINPALLSSYEDSTYSKLVAWLSGSDVISADEAKQFMINLGGSNAQLAQWASNFESVDWAAVKNTFKYISDIGAMDFAGAVASGNNTIGYKMMFGETLDLDFDDQGNIIGTPTVSKGSLADLITKGLDPTKMGLSVVYDANGNVHVVPINEVQNMVKKGYRYYQTGSQATDPMLRANPYSKTGAWGEYLNNAKKNDPSANPMWQVMQGYTPDEYGHPITEFGYDSFTGQELRPEVDNAVGTNITTGSLSIANPSIRTMNTSGLGSGINMDVPALTNDAVRQLQQAADSAQSIFNPDAGSFMFSWDQAVNSIGGGLDSIGQKIDQIGNMDVDGFIGSIVDGTFNGQVWDAMFRDSSNLVGKSNEIGENLGGALTGGFVDIMNDSKIGLNAMARTSADGLVMIRSSYDSSGVALANSVYDGYSSTYSANETQMIARAKATAEQIQSILQAAQVAQAVASAGGGGGGGVAVTNPNYKPGAVAVPSSGTTNKETSSTNKGTTSPVSKPVLDAISSGASKVIQSVTDPFAGIYAQSSYSSQLAQQAANAAVSAATASSDFKKTVNMSYTQNITSPKAVSRYDVYRDTSNMLARTKGAVNSTW